MKQQHIWQPLFLTIRRGKKKRRGHIYVWRISAQFWWTLLLHTFHQKERWGHPECKVGCEIPSQVRCCSQPWLSYRRGAFWLVIYLCPKTWPVTWSLELLSIPRAFPVCWEGNGNDLIVLDLGAVVTQIFVSGLELVDSWTAVIKSANFVGRQTWLKSLIIAYLWFGAC